MKAKYKIYFKRLDVPYGNCVLRARQRLHNFEFNGWREKLLHSHRCFILNCVAPLNVLLIHIYFQIDYAECECATTGIEVFIIYWICVHLYANDVEYRLLLINTCLFMPHNMCFSSVVIHVWQHIYLSNYRVFNLK